MRLIDAELLEEQFGISDADILAKEEIRFAPTVDAVVVTRCKDCKHRGGVQVLCNGINIDYCKVWDCTLRNLETTFCSYGERKDGGDG